MGKVKDRIVASVHSVSSKGTRKSTVQRFVHFNLESKFELSVFPLQKTKVCHFCGVAGHIFKNCREKKCSKCFGFGHTARGCPVTGLSCSLCGVDGHQDDSCTYHWRKYMTVTDKQAYEERKRDLDQCEGNFPFHKVSTANPIVSCFNCGKQNHFGYAS